MDKSRQTDAGTGNKPNNKNLENKNSELDYYVWVEKAVDTLKEKNLKKHVIDGMWTPSGFFHIGNSRAELLIPSFVAKRLKEEGINAKHNFIIDDLTSPIGNIRLNYI